MKEIEMLSALRPAAPVWPLSLSRKSTAAPCWLAGLLPMSLLPMFLLPMFLLLLTALCSAPASAQGSFTTSQPFTISLDATRHFTLKAIPVLYKPLNGTAVSGFLTLSGTPIDGSLTFFTNVGLSFSPAAGGTPTVADTVPLGTVSQISNHHYHLASVGASPRGNSFNLYGGVLAGSANSTSASPASASSTSASSTSALSRSRAASTKQSR